jgi:hypothetical protein
VLPDSTSAEALQNHWLFKVADKPSEVAGRRIACPTKRPEKKPYLRKKRKARSFPRHERQT